MSTDIFDITILSSALIGKKKMLSQKNAHTLALCFLDISTKDNWFLLIRCNLKMR